MGAKTWMLVYAEQSAREALRRRPQLDREATLKFANKLFPKAKLVPIGDGDLSYTSPPDNEIHIGCFLGVSVVAAKEFGIDYPSKVPASFLQVGANGMVYLHAMHSVVDWFAFAQWKNGQLQRSLSLSPDSGVLENIGAKLPFEEPYWAGQRPVSDSPEEASEYPFPFHPLELGEAALGELFGYQLEGSGPADIPDPETITLVKFKRSPWWKIW